MTRCFKSRAECGRPSSPLRYGMPPQPWRFCRSEAFQSADAARRTDTNPRHGPCSLPDEMRFRDLAAHRVVRGIVLVLVGLFAGYVTLANGFLMLGGIRLLTKGTNSVAIRFDSAWSLWPGVVHARGLAVTIQDHNVQSSMVFERADISLRMLELPRRVFHATRLRGSGLRFRFRHRVMPESASLPAVKALPPIEGFEDPPVFEALAPEPPIPDDHYTLWTVELDDVDVHANEIWIEQFRYLKHARATGTFRLKPARRLWVGPAALTLDSGRVMTNGRDALADFGGRIECTVRSFDVRDASGLEVMRFISAGVRLSGAFSSGAAVEAFLPEDARVDVRDGRLDVDAALHDGILAASSKAAVSGSFLGVRVGKTSAELDERWEVSAKGDEDGPGGAVTAFVSAGSFDDDECGSVSARGTDLTTTVTSTTRDTAAPWKLRGATLSVRDLEGKARRDEYQAAGRVAGDFAFVAAPGDDESSKRSVSLLARATDVRIRKASNWVVELPDTRISVSLDGAQLQGTASVTANRVAGSLGRTGMRFDASAALRSEATSLEAGRTAVSGSVDVRNASLSNAHRRVDDWWASLRLERMHLTVAESLDVDGRVVAHFRDGAPALFALAEEKQIPGWVPTVLPLHGLSGTIDVRRRCRTTDVYLPRLEGGPLVGSGRIHDAPGRTSGAVLVRIGGIGALSAGFDLGEDGGVSPFAGDAWLSERVRRMDAETLRARAAPCRVRKSTCGR